MPLILASGMLLAGCARESVTLADVSERLDARSGFSLNEKSDPEDFVVPPSVDLSSGVGERDAILLALWNNGAFQETLNDLGIAKADLLRAVIPPNPQLSMFFPIGPKQLEFTIRYPLETLWLRPRRIEIAELELERVAENLVQNGLNVIRDVKIAMADFRLARENARIASQSADLLARSAGLARARFLAGDASELEVATLSNDALRAREEARLLEYEITVARERLRLLTGLSFREVKFIEPESYAPPRLSRSLDQLVQDALASRPDLRAAEIAIAVSGRNAGLAETEIYALTGMFDSNNPGRLHTFEAGPGVELQIPIFDRNQAGIARAGAQLRRSASRYVAARNQIAMEVREAFARYRQAEQGIYVWREKMMRPLRKTVDQANKAYAAGETSLLPVLDATWNLVQARRREAESVAGLRRAIAELERSLGGRLDLIPTNKPGEISKK